MSKSCPASIKDLEEICKVVKGRRTPSGIHATKKSAEVRGNCDAYGPHQLNQCQKDGA
jgi:hypothetical protein